MPKFGRNYSVGDSNIQIQPTKNVKLTNLEPINDVDYAHNSNETPILARFQRQSEPIFSSFKDLKIHRKSIQTQLFLNGKNGNSGGLKRRSIACPKSEPKEETEWMALVQLLLPFLIAGFGNVAAGIILDNVQFWEVFVEIPQILILVPALLGLKGNVEMTLASRLSTHANMGHMDIAGDLKSIVIGNLSLVQCQASIMGLIAPLVAIALSFVNNNEENSSISFQEVVLVTASSLITANVANLVLGTLMCVVVILSRKFSINPDNIATPIAEAFGDITTLLLLAYISQALFHVMHNLSWLSPLFLAILLVITPIWGFFAYRSDYTKKVLLSGWLPILGGMILQNLGGLIMENALSRYERMASFQPVINGVGGNLAAIQSSRISTHLHKQQLRELDSNQKLCVSPFSVFFGKNPYSLMSKLLLLIALPGQLLFIGAIYLIRRNFDFTALLAVFYVSCALIQVAIVLILCFYMVQYFWRKNIDPDSTVIPFLTASADLLGSALLLFAFFLLHSLNDPNAKMTDDNNFMNALVSNSTFY